MVIFQVESPATVVPTRCEVIPNCICFERLKIGSVVAKRIRDKIFSEFGITRFGLSNTFLFQTDFQQFA